MGGEAYIPDTFGSDASPDLNPATFDFNAWIGGAKPTVRAIKLYARPDLKADMDVLEARIIAGRNDRPEDRGMNETSPEGLREEWQAIADDFEASAVTFKVQARSDKRVDRIRKDTKAANKGISDEDVELHVLADAIIDPPGITVAHLQAFNEVSEVQIKMLFTAASMANYQPPRVDVPFSPEPSKPRRQRG